MRIMSALRMVFLPCYSLFSRVRKGEGGLVVLTGALMFYYEPMSAAVAEKIGLSALVIALMYALNDIHDAPEDIADLTRKNRWTTTLVTYQPAAYAIHALTLGAFGVIAICLFSIRPLSLLSAFFVSTAYNLWGKRQVGFDNVLVFLWGPTFIYLFSEKIPFLIALIPGAMLLMNHTFQMARDSKVDGFNRIETTWVFSKQMAEVFYYAAAISVAIFFALTSHYFSAIASALPIIAGYWGGFTKRNWMITKIFQGLSVLLMFVRWTPIPQQS